MVIGSGLGLAIPAIRKTPNSSTRRHLRNRSWGSRPVRFSMMMSSGTSKAMPKASSIVMTKLMYWSTWIRLLTWSGVRPSR